MIVFCHIKDVHNPWLIGFSPRYLVHRNASAHVPGDRYRNVHSSSIIASNQKQSKYLFTVLKKYTEEYYTTTNKKPFLKDLFIYWEGGEILKQTPY